MKYEITIYSTFEQVLEHFVSNSRNARKHLANSKFSHACKCVVRLDDEIISYAMYMYKDLVLFGARRRNKS